MPPLNPHPNAHPSSGAYSNAAQIAADLRAVGEAARPRAVQAVRHFTMLLQTRVMAKASGRPGPRAVTGDYQRGWDQHVSPSGGTVEGVVYNNKPQARRLEYGFVGADRLGRVYNQPPFPHLGPAFDETSPEFLESLSDLGDWT